MQSIPFTLSNGNNGIAVFTKTGGSITTSQPISGTQFHQFNATDVEDKATFIASFIRRIDKENTISSIVANIDGVEKSKEIVPVEKTRKIIVIAGRRFDAESTLKITGVDDGRDVEITVPTTQVISKVVSIPLHSYCKNQFTEYALQQNNVSWALTKKHNLVSRISRLSKNRDILKFIEDTKAVGILIDLCSNDTPVIIKNTVNVPKTSKQYLYLTLV